MTQDEFLAVLEWHRLPWRLHDYTQDDGIGFTDERGDGVHELSDEQTQALADAAPAMAAAIIRFLRVPWYDRTTDDVAALRAALPPDLRP